MTAPAPARRLTRRWLYVIPIVGALGLMFAYAAATTVLSCGGVDIRTQPPEPPMPPTTEIAQTP